VAALGIRPEPAQAAGVADMSWTGWFPAAPGFVTNVPLAPVASFLRGAVVWLFGTGQNGRIYANRSADGHNWVGWSEVPGNGWTPSRVSAATGAHGEIVLTARGGDNAIYVNSTPDGINWTGWIDTGGATYFGPLAGYPYTNLFAVGTDGEMFSNPTGDLHNFGGWRVVPGNGVTNAELAMVNVNIPSLIIAQQLFHKGLDNRIYENTVSAQGNLSPSSMGHWTELPGNGMTDAAPTAASGPNTDLIDYCVFVKGLNSQRVYVNRIGPFSSFVGWQEVPGGGLTNLAPTAVTSISVATSDRLFLFVVGLDNAPYLNIGS
jgi:hypothetical protein